MFCGTRDRDFQDPPSPHLRAIVPLLVLLQTDLRKNEAVAPAYLPRVA